MSANENRSFVEELQALGKDVERSADEVRVKIHLASMDAKDAWKRIQPRIEQFDSRVATAARELASGAKHAGEELRDAGKDLKAELRKISERL